MAYATLKMLYHEQLANTSYFSILPIKIAHSIAAIFVSSMLEICHSRSEELFYAKGERMIESEMKKSHHIADDYSKILQAELLLDFKRIVDFQRGDSTL